MIQFWWSSRDESRGNLTLTLAKVCALPVLFYPNSWYYCCNTRFYIRIRHKDSNTAPLLKCMYREVLRSDCNLHKVSRRIYKYSILMYKLGSFALMVSDKTVGLPQHKQHGASTNMTYFRSPWNDLFGWRPDYYAAYRRDELSTQTCEEVTSLESFHRLLCSLVTQLPLAENTGLCSILSTCLKFLETDSLKHAENWNF